MEVAVNAKLRYDDGLNFGCEGLWVKIKFREKGKLFKKKLRFYIVKYHDSDSANEYIDSLKYYADNKEKVVEFVKEKVKDYFRFKFGMQSENDAINSALKKLEDMKDFEVKVKVD